MDHHHHHRPPVLLQDHQDSPRDIDLHDHSFPKHPSDLPPFSLGPSQDIPPLHHPPQNHAHLSHHTSPDYNDEFLDYYYSGKRPPGLLDDEQQHPPHIHSQACQDSCPVQDIYTEAGYWRFSRGARTNLYGLVAIKELENASPSLLPVDHGQDSTPANLLNSFKGNSSTRSTIFTTSGNMAYNDLPTRYVLVAAGAIIRCFTGVQDSFEFSIDGGAAPLAATAKEPTAGGGAGGPSTETPVTDGSNNSGGSGATASSTSGFMNVLMPAPGPSQEIISMDAFVRKDERGCQLVVVVSIAKAEDPPQFELRFFGSNTFGTSIRELLLQLPTTSDIQTIPLAWAPTKIIHAPVEDDPFDMAVLVAGSDSCVHFFAQDILSMQHPGHRMFDERSIDTHFSVLTSFSYCEHCVLSLAVKDYLTCRVVAAGTQNGTLNIGIIPRDPVTLKLNQLQAKSHTVVLFAPITTLAIFTSRVQPTKNGEANGTRDGNEEQTTDDEQANNGDGHDNSDKDNDKGKDKEEEVAIHLLVTCAIEQAWVYSDIAKHGLGRRSDLVECSHHDSILATYIMDADWDGRNEIMVGTYGRQLMVFKELAPGQVPYPSSSSLDTDMVSTPGSLPERHSQHQHHPHQPQQQPPHVYPPLLPRLRRQNSYQPTQGSLPLNHQYVAPSQPSLPPSPPPIQWGMTWNRRFATPLYGITSADLNNDGLEELVITTIHGISIFLPDPWAAKQRLAQAIERMREIEEMRVMLEKLRKSNKELFEAAATEAAAVAAQRAKEQAEQQEEVRKLQEQAANKEKDENDKNDMPEQKETEEQSETAAESANTETDGSSSPPKQSDISAAPEAGTEQNVGQEEQVEVEGVSTNDKVDKSAASRDQTSDSADMQAVGEEGHQDEQTAGTTAPLT